MFKVDKSKLKDEKGRYLTQSLFLEDKYNTDLAVYTYDGEDKEYKGVVYPSLKRLYLDMGDPKEYLFANEYLYDWPHWQRLCSNAVIGRHIEQWRTELDLSLEAEGVATLVDLATNEKSYQAAKYLADKGWKVKGRGRPSKADIENELKKAAKEQEEFSEGFKLLKMHKRDKNA